MRERITSLFNQNALAHQKAAESLADSLIEAAEWITGSLLTENKVMCCGAGAANSLSQYFCYAMLNSLERERPALPAINLCSESALSAISDDPTNSGLFSNQIQALGQPGDTLLIIAGPEQNISLHQAIQTAEQREIKVVLLNCNEAPWWDSEPNAERLEVFTPVESKIQTQQLHLTSIQAICELIEMQLFGA